MKTKQPVRWIVKKFGGRYRTYGKKRGAGHVWGIYSSPKVVEILDGCLPYLKTKRKKAIEVRNHAYLKCQTKNL
jgi:hypothetical protein